jgi:ATP-dependent exoDNAse (exonuclease V) alpha subunit
VSESKKRRKQRKRKPKLFTAGQIKESVRKEDLQESDVAWGTSPGQMGRVKAESEEARLESCPECGYSGGRHSMMCSKKP